METKPTSIQFCDFNNDDIYMYQKYDDAINRMDDEVRFATKVIRKHYEPIIQREKLEIEKQSLHSWRIQENVHVFQKRMYTIVNPDLRKIDKSIETVFSAQDINIDNVNKILDAIHTNFELSRSERLTLLKVDGVSVLSVLPAGWEGLTQEYVRSYWGDEYEKNKLTSLSYCFDIARTFSDYKERKHIFRQCLVMLLEGLKWIHSNKLEDREN